MKIKIQLRNVYGTYKVYPVCDKARAFASISKASTLTVETLKNIEALGYSFEYVRWPFESQEMTFAELNKAIHSPYEKSKVMP